jgi:hypothetical protein
VPSFESGTAAGHIRNSQCAVRTKVAGKPAVFEKACSQPRERLKWVQFRHWVIAISPSGWNRFWPKADRPDLSPDGRHNLVPLLSRNRFRNAR